MGVNKDHISEEDLTRIKEELRDKFVTRLQGSGYSLEGLMLTHSNKKGSDQPDSEKDIELLYGKSYYTEIILGKEFRV